MLGPILDPRSTPSIPFRHDDFFRQPQYIHPPRPMRRITPRTQAYGQAPEGYIQRRTRSIIDWMLGRESPRAIRRIRRLCGNPSEKDGGECHSCHVVGPLARFQPRPSLLSNRGARARERPPFRKVARRSPAHEISMKQQRGYKCLTRARAPPRPSLGIMRVPSKVGR